MGFDLLTEPWIPVLRPDGSTEEVGIRKLLLSAHQYTEITDSIVTREYGVYRFLFALLMDAYQPEDSEALEELLEEGKFDAEILEEYFKNCQNEGVSFDLFDPIRPFMQAGPDPDMDEKICSVAKLEPVYPSGNNHVHFEHRFEDMVTFSPAEAARSLCAVTAFGARGGRGYPSIVNGIPPVYVIVRGRNLFETLVLGMVPRAYTTVYDNPPVLWRWQGKIEPKKEVASTSLLMGLTFPCRYVRLIEKDGKGIEKMVYAQGMNFVGYGSYQDPYVAYRYSKKDGSRFSIKAQPEKELWRELGELLDCNGNGAAIVRQAEELVKRDQMQVVLYSVAKQKDSYLDAAREEYRLPAVLLRTCWPTIKACLEYVEKKGGMLNDAFRELQKALGEDEKKDGIMTAICRRKMAVFYEDCRHAFFAILQPRLAEAKSSEWGMIHGEWNETVQRYALKEYNAFIEETGMKARGMIAQQECRKYLFDKKETQEKRKGK